MCIVLATRWAQLMVRVDFCRRFPVHDKNYDRLVKFQSNSRTRTNLHGDRQKHREVVRFLGLTLFTVLR